jgi:hypothetical protein
VSLRTSRAGKGQLAVTTRSGRIMTCVQLEHLIRQVLLEDRGW